MATYRAAEVSDTPALSQLARRALQPYALPGWTRPAIERLLNENSEIALRDSLPKAAFAHVGLESGSVVGFIASTSPRPSRPARRRSATQRHGIGSRLLETMFEFVAVHAPDVSVYSLSEFVDHDGCSFARLGFWRKNPLLIR